MLVKVINLHRMAYRSALDIQKKLFQQVKQVDQTKDSLVNYLLLVEHEPVYTVGIRDKQYRDTEFQEKLKQLGADFVLTNRGGLITFHGVGQLVAYPIVNLTNFPVTQRSIKKFVCLLESAIIDVCQDFGITNTGRLTGHPGVWVDGERKVAALGIHASKYVTMHGVAINCNVDLRWFNHIVPCGIPDKTVTSISAELHREVTIKEVNSLFVKHFCQRLQCRNELIDKNTLE